MLTAIVLTYNEQLHIARCIESLKACCSRICIVDSFSTDATCEIARSLGAEVIQNAWQNNYALQLNWAIANCNITTPWILRIDADEFLLPALQNEIITKLAVLPEAVTGVNLNRRVIFKGKWIRHGGFYPTKLLRIWRTGLGHCEQRMMDEHMVVRNGATVQFQHDFVDDNLNSIDWWARKHLGYARREAVDHLNQKYGLYPASESSTMVSTRQAKRKRFLKDKIYARLPLLLRPSLYFLFRFVFQLGFLDGPRGWLFHFVQGFWYRLMVDASVWELESQAQANPEKIKDIIQNVWGIQLHGE